MCVVFFLFKQKTAYEMRISDWSSDVCSSDLPGCRPRTAGSRARQNWSGPRSHGWKPADPGRNSAGSGSAGRGPPPSPRTDRSEEHTSELQSLMRISYAVFCLKKKTYIYCILISLPLHSQSE